MEEEATYILPSPTDTPYRTPSSSSRSPRSQTYDMSPSTTPPPLPEDRNAKRRSTDSINPALDDNISPLDPRRFTPTLHASLVSEILSLRRDLENRTNDIEKLEQSLHQSQQQNDLLNTNLLNSNKQTREVKRQMQLLEGGTLSAISDISKERDDALSDVTELRRRLEQSQRRAKTQEETAERTQALWDKEREAWQNEKRGLETKVHIAEGRLKVVISEISNAQQSNRPISPERRAESRNSILESPGKGRGRGRRHSANSINSDQVGGRVSVLSFANGTTINLADELAFDEEEEDHFNHDYPSNGRLSPDALPEEQMRPASSLSIKARKVLGLPFDFEGEDSKDNVDPSKPETIIRQSVTYVDTAVQFSPPPSPSWTRGDSQQTRRSRPADLRFSDGRQSLPGFHSPTSPTESMDSKYAPWNYTGPIMVSSGCQTVEALPSPPLTPEKADGTLSTIHESVGEVETVTVGTQTDPVQIKPQPSWHHINTGSGDLQIPLINIIPPTSRPVTPEISAVVLPPRTKNAGAQVDLSLVGLYKSSAMQTEEIRVDRRNIIPASQMPHPPPTSSFKAPVATRPPVPMRGRKPSPAMLASQRMNVGISRIPPTTDPASATRDFAAKPPAPVRSSSLYQGFDDTNDVEEDRFDDDTFPEDDVFSRPTAKFTLRSGKLVSQDPVLEDIGESFAISAGEAAAMETLRASEDSLPPNMKQFFMQGRNTPPVGTQRPPPVPSKSLRRVPSAKSNNMRRAALISSGSAAHKASNSASTNASMDSANPPPFPVPLRYSSARVGKSVSEGGRSSRASSAASPTKTSRFKGKNILRKTRSGPAISPHAQARKSRSRSRSPPVESRVSIVPEMPTFQMPAEPPSFLSEPYSDPREASAPRPSIATGPSRQKAHMKTNSDAVSMQQTSVVDSIAQTMVGEWMYKYVRRRKSFGMTDKPDWDANKSMEEISASVTNNGVRHKRWVWLAPYERAVMWSSKQPTSGSALMGGKSGRKLTIKSVLDVKDDNVMPKGSISGPHFNRSILILTPQRALKFTATSQDRHFIWLTALSFLSHSPLSVNDLTAMPPPPPDDQILSNPPPPSLAGSLRRRPIRDSIRIAKGTKPQGGLRSFTTDGSLPVSYDEYNSRPPSRDYYDPTQDSALPPTIKRFHSRKRSNTAPKPPPSSFRGFTASSRDIVPPLPAPGGYAGTVSSSVIASTNGSDRGLYTPSLGVQSMSSSRRGSEASNGGRPPPNHILADHSQTTVRMDAFAEPPRIFSQPPNRPWVNGQHMNGGGPFPALRGGTLRKNKDWGYWGIDDGRNSISPVDSLMHSEMMAAAEGSARPSVESRMTDPFRGF